MAKMCKCKRGFVLTGKGCCAECWAEAMAQYDAGLFDASQQQRDVQPYRQPRYDKPTPVQTEAR